MSGYRDKVLADLQRAKVAGAQVRESMARSAQQAAQTGSPKIKTGKNTSEPSPLIRMWGLGSGVTKKAETTAQTIGKSVSDILMPRADQTDQVAMPQFVTQQPTSYRQKVLDDLRRASEQGAQVKSSLEQSTAEVEKARTKYQPSVDQRRRDNYAKAHPEDTGGAWGEYQRGKNSVKTYKAAAEGMENDALRYLSARSKEGGLTQQYDLLNYAVSFAVPYLTQMEQSVLDLQDEYQKTGSEDIKKKLVTMRKAYRAEAQAFSDMWAQYSELSTKAGLERRMDELDAAYHEMDSTIAANAEVIRTTEMYGYGPDTRLDDVKQRHETAKARKGELHTLQGEIHNAHTDLLNEFYLVENEGQWEGLQADPAAKSAYDRAEELQADMDKASWVMAYTVAEHTDTAKIKEEADYLAQKYGLTRQAINNYSAFGAVDAPRQEGETYENVYQLYKELEREKNQVVAELNEKGYRFERLAGYRQRLADMEEYARFAEALQEKVSESPWTAAGASAMSFIISPLQIFDLLKVAGDASTGGSEWDRENYVPVNYYNMDATNFVDITRGTVAENIAKAAPFEVCGVNVMSMLYNTTMSMGDSYLRAQTLGVGSVFLSGASAAATQAKRTMQRGGSNAQILQSAVAAGAAEIVFEKISVERLLNPKYIGDPKTYILEALKQGGVEASEEVLTEIANILSDAAIMGTKSDFNLAVQAYEDGGMTHEQAVKQAYLDCVGQVAMAGVGGLLSGYFMSSAHNLPQLTQEVGYNKQLGKTIRDMGSDVEQAILQTGLESDVETDSYKLAQKLQGKQDLGKTIRPRELGQLYRANVAAIDAENVASTGDTQSLPTAVQVDPLQTIDRLTAPLPTAQWTDGGLVTGAGLRVQNALQSQMGLQPDLSRTFESQKVPSYEELVAKPDIPVVDIRSKPEGRMSDQRAAFKESVEALDIVGQPIMNADTGAAVFVTSKTFSHSFSNLGLDQVGAALKLKEIIQSAVLTHAETSRKAPADNSTGVYTLFAAVQTENGIQPVKLKIKEYRLAGQRVPKEIKAYFERTGATMNTYAQNYDTKVLELTDIKREGASSSAPTDTAETAAVEYPSAPSLISIRELLGLVKGDAAKYIPAVTTMPEAPNVFDLNTLGDAQPSAQNITLPTAQSQQQGDVELVDGEAATDTMSEESWASLMEQYPSPEPLSDDYLEALMREGETGYVPEESRTAQEIAWDQDLDDAPETVRRHMKPTAEATEAPQWADAIAETAKTVVRDYESKADAEEIAEGLQNIFERMGAEDRLNGPELTQMAKELAQKILEQVEVTNNEVYEDSKAARALIRSQTIHVPAEVALDIPDFNDFRKRYFGSMKISSTQGRAIDDLFKELANYDAGYFDAQEHLALSDQLVQIAKYLDDMKPSTENPYLAVMDEASEVLGQELLKSLDPLHSRRVTLRNVAQTRHSLDEFWEGAGKKPGVANVLTELPDTQKDPMRLRAKEAWRTFYRAMVDTGETVGRIGTKIRDPQLYAYYNFARASGSAAQNMIQKGGYQSDITGNKVGPSLGDIFSPIRAKGDTYYQDFEQYLFHMHNIDRMSIANSAALDIAAANFQEFQRAHPDIATIATTDLLDIARSGMGADVEFDANVREYVRLEREYNKAKGRKNKPVFGESVDAAVSQGEVDRLIAAHPEFQELAQQVYDYANNLLRYRVDSGLLSQEQMDSIQKLYPHYVPTYRVLETDARAVIKAGVKISKDIGLAQGGNADLVPVHIALARQTMQVIKDGSANRFANRLLADYYANKSALNEYIHKVEKTAGTDGLDEFERIMWTKEQASEVKRSGQDGMEAFDQLRGKDKASRTVTVYEDGEQLTLTVDQGLMEAMDALVWTAPGTQTMDKLDRLLKGVERFYNRPFKMLTTGVNPTFIAKNLVRDFQEALFYSDYRGTWTRKYLGAFTKIINNDPVWQQYKALGGVYASYLDYNKGYSEDTQSGIRKALGRLEAINEAIEQAPRLAEFEAHIAKNGTDMDSLMEAMHAAANITVNFGRSGDVGGLLNRTIAPYFNAAVQGTDKLVRTFVGKKNMKQVLHLLAGIMLVCALPRAVDELLCYDEPGWEDIPDSIKNAYWLIPIGDGKYMRLPKANGTSVPDMVLATAGKAVAGQDVDWMEMAGDAANQSLPDNFLNSNIFTSMSKVALFDPKDPGETWYGGDIESQRLQGYAPGQRYDEKTDAISKAVGGALNISPKKLNYILDQNTGVIGDIFLPMATPAGDKDPLAFFKKGFTYDTVTQNKLGSDFYDTKDRLTYEKNEGQPAKAVTLRFVNKRAGEVSDLYDQIRAVQNAGLPNDEMLEQVRELRRQINDIQRETLEVLPDYEAAVAKHYPKTGKDQDKVDVAYREANREIFGAEYALQMEGTAVYAKAQEANRRGVSYENYYTVYLALKGKDKKADKMLALSVCDIPAKERDALHALLLGDTTYDRFVDCGLSDKEAQTATWAVESILPSVGRSSPSDVQKWRAVITCGLPANKTMNGLQAVMDDTQYGKLAAAYSCGVSPKIYVTFQEELAKTGSKTQETTSRVLAGIAMSDEDRAVLWQLTNTSWKSKNNPYGSSAGEKALQIYRADK